LRESTASPVVDFVCIKGGTFGGIRVAENFLAMASGASSSTPKTEREQKKLEHDVSVLLSTFAVASNHSSML
jgi:hypothetical protein